MWPAGHDASAAVLCCCYDSVKYISSRDDDDDEPPPRSVNVLRNAMDWQLERGRRVGGRERDGEQGDFNY